MWGSGPGGGWWIFRTKAVAQKGFGRLGVSEEARTLVVGWLAAVTVRFFLICVQSENFPTGWFWSLFLRMFYLFRSARTSCTTAVAGWLDPRWKSGSTVQLYKSSQNHYKPIIHYLVHVWWRLVVFVPVKKKHPVHWHNQTCSRHHQTSPDTIRQCLTDMFQTPPDTPDNVR